MKRYEFLIAEQNRLHLASLHNLGDGQFCASWEPEGLWLPATSCSLSPENAKRLADWIYYMLEEYDGELKLSKEVTNGPDEY